MRRLRGAFRGLRWRLTLSYVLVTVVAAVIIQFAVAVAAKPKASAPPTDQSSSNGIAKELQLAVELQLGPYLDQRPPDGAAISTWLAYSTHSSVPGRKVVGISLDKAALVQVTDGVGRVLASSDAAGAQARTLLALPQAQAALHAALADVQDYSELARRLPDGRLAVALPIESYDGRFLGTFFAVLNVSADPRNLVRVNGQSVQDYLVATTTQQVLPVTLGISLLAILVGTLFGVLTSRGITRRLRRLAGAADAWSRGDLGVAVRDPSPDEFGQLSRHLDDMAEQLQALLATRGELAVVEERNRLARDLHDSVKQEVFATAMQVAAARALLERDPAAAQDRLAAAERLAGQAQRELTALIQELRPAALADRGLAAALRAYCAEWSRQAEVAAEVRVQHERPAPLEMEQALFRVAQEALANVARHSGAARVEIHLAWERTALTLAVRDDGRGFAGAGRAGTGLGLLTMRERVEGLGGSLLVSSTGGGTRVEARVPLPEETATVAGTNVRAPAERAGGTP